MHSQTYEEQWELTGLEFEKSANFPHCLGTVDGKHTRVTKPEHSGSMFHNYKYFFSRGINGRGRH
jgi:hypothetical protein